MCFFNLLLYLINTKQNQPAIFAWFSSSSNSSPLVSSPKSTTSPLTVGSDGTSKGSAARCSGSSEMSGINIWLRLFKALFSLVTYIIIEDRAMAKVSVSSSIYKWQWCGKWSCFTQRFSNRCAKNTNDWGFDLPWKTGVWTSCVVLLFLSSYVCYHDLELCVCTRLWYLDRQHLCRLPARAFDLELHLQHTDLFQELIGDFKIMEDKCWSSSRYIWIEN